MMSKLFLSLCLFVLIFVPGISQTRIISHVTDAAGGFATSLVIENTASVPGTVRLQPYQADGGLMEAVSVEVGALSVLRANAHTLLGDAVSHVTIEGGDDFKVNTYYDFKAGNSSPAFVGESSQQGSIWRLFPGNWDKVFDGIAVVNMGSEPTDVWIAQKDNQNNVVASRKVATDLAPNAKALFIIGSPTVRDFSSEDAYFEVSADQLLALTALQGTLENENLNILLAAESRPMSGSATVRDDKGVWTIHDGDLYDIFEMMGYTVTKDRLWQMDLYRRQARGTIAEMISPLQIPGAAEVDILNRQRGFSDDELATYFAALDAESQIMFQAYADGINRRIGEVNDTAELLPLEYKALNNERVVPFSKYDLMAHLANFQVGFSMRTFGTEQVLNAELLQRLEAKYGAEQAAVMFNDLRYTSDPQSQTMIAGAAAKSTTKADQPLALLRGDLPDLSAGLRAYAERLENIRNTLKDNGMLIKGGSYAWVVDGSKTETGNPMLYSGPQVGFSAPVLFVEGNIKSDVVNVAGMAIPGIPAIIVGRTKHHAWSMQVGYGGTWDYYLEDAEDVQVVRQETIVVKDAENIVIDIETSSHGPIIEHIGDKRLAFKYAHRDYNFNVSTGLLNLARATNMDEFGEAAAELAVSQHLCYVDQDGNIAYWHTGRQPIRPEGDYRVPQGILANQDVLEWDAANVAPLIHERNPEKGYFAGWNNKPSPDFVDVSATTALGPYHRGHAVQDFFEAYNPADKWSFEELSELAVDISTTGNWAAGGNPWTQLGEAVTTVINANPTDERLAILAMFDEWDGHAVAGGPDAWVAGRDLADASVFLDAMIPELVAKTFNDELGTTTVDQQMLTRFQVFLHGVYSDGLSNNYDWFTNLEDSAAPQTAEAIILATVDELSAQLGARPWGINQRGVIDYIHPIFRSLSQAGATSTTPGGHRATYAQCVEYAQTGLTRAESFFALGQSGTVTGTTFVPRFDGNSFNMAALFNAFTLRTVPLFD